MKRSSIAGVTALLVLSSSVAFGLALKHTEYDAKVVATDGSKIHGTATMKSTADDKGTMVDFKIMGDAANATHPWHIHKGSCEKPGGVWGGGASYKPIVADAKGDGESKTTIAMAVPDTGSYYVNVHESATNMGKQIACGDLKMKM
jgi:hypothetical protein